MLTDEVTPLKKGAAPETNRLRAFIKHSLVRRFVAGIRGVDIARYRDERLPLTAMESEARASSWRQIRGARTGGRRRRS